MSCVTMSRQNLLHLVLSDGRWVPPLVVLHVLPPDDGHVVLQLEDLDHVQVSRTVGLEVAG